MKEEKQQQPREVLPTHNSGIVVDDVNKAASRNTTQYESSDDSGEGHLPDNLITTKIS
jgi:hypothetical protein